MDGYRFGLAGEGQADVIQARLDATFGMVLDIGCGPYRDSIAALADHASMLIAVDHSPLVIGEAARKAGHERVRFLVAEAVGLPLRSGAAQHVLALGLFAYISEPGPVIAEFARVCRPNGDIVITNAVRHAREPILEAAEAAGLELVDHREDFCPAASGTVKRRYLLVFGLQGASAHCQP